MYFIVFMVSFYFCSFYMSSGLKRSINKSIKNISPKGLKSDQDW